MDSSITSTEQSKNIQKTLWFLNALGWREGKNILEDTNSLERDDHGSKYGLVSGHLWKTKKGTTKNISHVPFWKKRKGEKKERERIQEKADYNLPLCAPAAVKKKRVSQKEKKKHIPAIVLSVISEVLSLINEGVCVCEKVYLTILHVRVRL